MDSARLGVVRLRCLLVYLFAVCATTDIIIPFVWKEASSMHGANLRCVLFSVVFVLCITSICGLKIAAVANVPMLGGLVSHPAASHLEGRSYQKIPILSLDRFMDKSYQSELDRYVSDLVPNRDAVILANAAFQECAIAASAQLCGFRIYPTYFGSEHAYDKSLDAVIPIPKDLSGSRKRLCNQMVAAVRDFARTNSDKKMVFCLIEGLEYSSGNPLAHSVSYAGTNEQIVDEMLAELGEDVAVLNISIDTEDQYRSEYYKTDHHWTISGAYEGYASVLGILDPAKSPLVVDKERSWSVPFFGSYARLGLHPTLEPDYIRDVTYNESDISLSINGVPGTLEDVRHRALYDDGGYDKSKFVNRYGEYYHTDSTYGFIEFHNNDLDDGSSLLIIGDSYTNPIERFFSESFETVYCLDVRYADSTAQEVVSKFQPDSIVFIESLNSCLNDSFIKRLS